MPEPHRSDVEAQLRACDLREALPGAPEGCLRPAYGGQSLLNVPATLGALLGTPLDGVALPLTHEYWGAYRGVRRVVLLLCDALGYLQLSGLMGEAHNGVWARLAEHGRLLPMTSVFPSTTNTSLTSLLTGQPPLAHGILGYELWLREWGVLGEMLTLKPVYGGEAGTLVQWGLSPEDFVPVPPIGVALGAQGVRTEALVYAPHLDSGLTRMLYRGVRRVQGYADAGELWSKSLRVLRESGSDPLLLFAYYGAIDSVAHEHGTAGEHWKAPYHSVTNAFEEVFLAGLRERDRRDTLFVLIADHGFVDSPLALAHDSDEDPTLRHHLLVPWSGESRAAYLHGLHGDESERQAVEKALGQEFTVHPMAAAIEAGLFGDAPAYAESIPRLGHHLVLPRGLSYLDRLGKRLKLRGRHGGLLPEEALIPWLAVPLEAAR